MTKNIKIVGSDDSVLADPLGISVLDKISKLPNIHPPCIALPDFHYKEKMEAPSSVAIAVRDHLVPHFSSTSLNCGMGAIVTDIDCEKELGGSLIAFFNHIRQNRDDKKYNLSPKDLFKILELGPKALLGKYGVEESILDAFEFRGNVHKNNPQDFSEFEKVIPEGTLEHPEYSGLDKLGTNFSGNHFLEIQKVSEILDRRLAGQKGIHSLGQAIFMYHGGGGIIPGLLGAFFSRRKKGYDDGLRTNIRRYLYHLKRSPKLPLYDLYKHYLSNNKYFQFHIDSVQGQRLLFANNCSMNYGYAYRLFKYIRVRDAIQDLFGKTVKVSLFSDTSHNSVFEDEIDGQKTWVHRHNSCRIAAGEFVVLPGFNNTSSYLCVGMDAQSSLYTMPHGAGALIDSYKKQGLLSESDTRFTQIFRGEHTKALKVNHFSDEAVNRVVDELEKDSIARPIVRLEPVASLKGYK